MCSSHLSYQCNCAEDVNERTLSAEKRSDIVEVFFDIDTVNALFRNCARS